MLFSRKVNLKIYHARISNMFKFLFLKNEGLKRNFCYIFYLLSYLTWQIFKFDFLENEALYEQILFNIFVLFFHVESSCAGTICILLK